MKRKLLLLVAAMAMLVCLLAISVSAEVDPNADYYDKVYTDANGNEFPIYEKVGDTYEPLVWFAYDVKGIDEATGEEVVVETKYVKARFADINCYSLEPSQGRFNGCYYDYTDEKGNVIALDTRNLVVLNLRAGAMAQTYSGSKKVNSTTSITVLTIETNRTDIFPAWSRIEAVYIPHTQKTVGSLNWGTLRVCDIDVNHPIPVTIGSKAFQDSKIEELFIPGGSKFDGNSNFQGCTKLKKVVFGEGFNAALPGYLFDRCSSLETICFMDSESVVDAIQVTTVNNSYYINATKVSAAAYEALTEKKGVYKIFDCTECIAFNNGVHTMSDEKTVVGGDFFASSKIVCSCTVEGCTASMNVGTIEALFTNELGYSAKTFGGDIALICGYGINRDAIDEYVKYASDFDFGILAAVNNKGEGFTPDPDASGVVDIVFDNMANDYIEVKLTGVPATERDTSIVFCAYVKVGGKIYYLENGVTSESATGVSYNDLVK